MKTITKKSLYLLIFFLTFSFSCKEKQLNISANNAINGLWQIESKTYNGFEIISSDYEVTFEFFALENSKEGTLITTDIGLYIERIDTFAYRIKDSGTEIKFNGTTHEIKQLTDERFTLHSNTGDDFEKIKAVKL